MYGIMPGVVTISSKFDLFFVNTLGLPANSGMVFHILILVAVLFILAVRFSFYISKQSKECDSCNCSSFFYRNLGYFRFSYS